MPYWLEKCREITWSEIMEELPGLGHEIASHFRHTSVNMDAATTYDPQNYIAFVDRRGKVRARLDDISGWHLLEALVKEALCLPLEPELKCHLAEFGNGTLCGWWKEQALQEGKRLFVDRKPYLLTHDVDDTAWYAKLRRLTVTDEQLEPFLSPDTLPRAFHELAQQSGVDRRYILRTWAHKVWHKWDCDLLCMANMISALSDSGSELQRRVFEENQKLINAAIPRLHTKLMMYYEPKIVGVFLLLFYDREHRAFLSADSRAALREELKHGQGALKEEELSSRWAGDDSITYLWGYNLQWRNGTLPALFGRYANCLLSEQAAGANSRPMAVAT